MEENKSDKSAEKKWKIIGERYAEMYPNGFNFAMGVALKTEEIFRKISPHYGDKIKELIEMDEDGYLVGSEIFPFILGAIGEMINKETKKIQSYLKYATPDLENLIECPYCKEYNPPDKKYCVHCQKQIIKEDLNGKKE